MNNDAPTAAREGDPSQSEIMLRVADGQFDDLPGGPWRTPPGADYRGVTTAALSANFALGGQGGVVRDAFFGVNLTFRHFGVHAHHAELKHVIQIVADEFEVLVLLDLPITGVLMACRGNKDALVRVAGVLADGYAGRAKLEQAGALP